MATGISTDSSKVNIIVFIHGDTTKAEGIILVIFENNSPESLIRALRVSQADSDGKCFNAEGEAKLDSSEVLDPVSSAAGRPCGRSNPHVLEIQGGEVNT